VRKLAIVLSGLAVAAAGGWFASSELIPGPPESIAITSSDDVALTPTARFRFVAQVRDVRGRLLSVRPIWTSEATIDPEGLFSAPDKTGVYFVDAAVGTLKATARITVNAGTPKTVRVLPANTTVKPREAVAFSATAFDEWGNSVPAMPTWRVSFGSGAIDDQGTFVAGSSGTATVTAEIQGLASSSTVTAQCVPPRNETVSGLSFTVVCSTNADIWMNGPGLDANTVAKTIDQAVGSVETTFARSLRHRLNVNVFGTQKSFAQGLQQLLHVQTSPFEEGVFVPPAIIAIDWSAPDGPEAIARHEITHLFVDEIAARRLPVPYWLHEGLATLSEFPVAEDAALVSRYCTASAARNDRLPTLAEISSPQDWRTYVTEVGVVAYDIAAQITAFMVSDAGGQTNLLDKMAGGLPLESAYEAASGHSFTSFVADLPDRARALADRYPGVAVTRRLFDGTVVYVAYGQQSDSRVTIDIRNSVYFGGGPATTDYFGCLPAYLGASWPRGSYIVTVTGAMGRATATLVK